MSDLDLGSMRLLAGCWLLAGGKAHAWICADRCQRPVDTEKLLQLVPLLSQDGAYRHDPVGEMSCSVKVWMATRAMEPEGLRLLRAALAATDESIGRLAAASDAIRFLRDWGRQKRDDWRVEAHKEPSEHLHGAVDAADDLQADAFDLWMRLTRFVAALWEDRDTLRQAVEAWAPDRERERMPYLGGAPVDAETAVRDEVAKRGGLGVVLAKEGGRL